MSTKQSPAGLLFRFARPLELLAGMLLYALGAGLTVYLGNPINWSYYFLGQGCVTMLQLSAYFLKAAFDLPSLRDRLLPAFQDDEIRQQAAILSRNNVLMAAATTLTTGAVLTVILMSAGVINSGALVIIGVGLSIALAYAIPPIRLVFSGYGELVQAILIANIIPSLACIIQFGELHLLLWSLTFPLATFYISLQLAITLQTYAQDELKGRRTAMVRLGWVHGMTLHNLLILGGYLLLVVSSLVNLPWSLLRAGLLTLPIGIFQIWQVVRIMRGARPNWVVLIGAASTTFALTAYFITFALWTV